MSAMDWDIMPTASISSITLVAISVLWLIFRLNQVLKQPVEELVQVLGLEVPTSPQPTILKITSSSVSLQWGPSDQRHSVSKYALRINGIHLGDVSETAVCVGGLRPSTFYTIRVTAINSANFQAPSDGVRIATLQRSLSDENGNRTEPEDTSSVPTPDKIKITPIKVQPEALPLAPANTPPITREHSGSVPPNKRVTNTKQRSSSQDDSAIEGSSAQAARGTAEQLNLKLGEIRRDLIELDTQEKEEEEEFQATRSAMLDKRELLRQQMKERDDESKELKKTVTNLERTHAAALSRKSALERMLQQKVGERAKLQEDIERFAKEQEDLQLETTSLRQQKQELLEEAQKKVQEIKNSQEEDLANIKALEDRIRERGVQVKDLEEEKKALQDDSEDGDLIDWQRKLEADDREWRTRCHELTLQYQQAYAAHNQATILYQQASQRFDYAAGRRGSQPVIFSQVYNADAPSFSPETQGSLHLVGSRNNFGSPEGRPVSFPYRTGPTTAFPTVPPLAPFTQHGQQGLNESSVKESLTISEAEREQLTGGALTSPGAAGLLPSGLLGDDTDEHLSRLSSQLFRGMDEARESRAPSTVPRPLSMSFGRPTSQSPGLLPGLGSIPGRTPADGPETLGQPTSPISMQSQSPSLVSSPHGSLSHLPHRLSEGPMDSDRRSIRSASGSSRMFPSKRFGDLWGRQRGKTTSNDGPAFGSLKPSETQSLSRASDDDRENFDPNVAPTRKYTNTGGLFGISSAMRGKRSARGLSGEESDRISLHSLDHRKNNFQLFGSRANPWSTTSLNDQPPSPRPGSTYSIENVLPHPSVDSGPFGWNLNYSSRRNSVSTGPPAVHPWSSSRRQSLLPEESVDSELDEHQRLRRDQITPPQAPIGTKPSKERSKTSSSGQSEPTSRDFMSLFGRDKKSSDKGSDRSGGKSKKKTTEKRSINSLATSTATTEDHGSLRGGSSRDDASVTGRSYLSRDFHGSEAATDSADEAGDDYAGEASVPSTPLDPPGTPGTPLTPSGSHTPIGKESLMRKITRKTSSSSRFSLKGARFSRNKQTSAGDDTPTSATTESTPILGIDELESSIDSLSPNPAMMTSDNEADREKEKRRQKRSSTGFSISSLTKRKDRDSKNIAKDKGVKEKGRKIENADGNGHTRAKDDAPSISEASLTSEMGESGEEGSVTGLPT